MIEIRYEKMETTSETREAYDEIYSREGILHRDSFYLWLIGLLNPVTGRSLLDISCGEGRLVALAKEAGLEAIGVDFSIEGVRKGSQNCPEAKWAGCDGEALPFDDGRMDYITHIGSLEHYQDPSRGAKEIGRVLKPGGVACILLPNAFGLLGNIRHVLRTGQVFDDGLQPIQRYGTRGAWVALLEGGGLKVLRVLGYGEVERPRTAADLRWMASHPQKAVKLALAGIIPVNLQNHLVFLCTVR
jgi:SAM-dependent methyltransferase